MTPSRPVRGGSSARDKLRAHFLANVGRVIDAYELREVAGGITEWARRVRELRQNEGWEIITDKDDSSLKPGQYLLRTDKPRPVISEGISKELRAFILDRNGFTCQMCGVGAGAPHPSNRDMKTRLHIGHITDLSHGGTNEPSNLRALCSVCNEGAQNATLPKPDTVWLISQVRRADGVSQRAVLDFLVRKFPQVAESILVDSRRPLRVAERPPT